MDISCAVQSDLDLDPAEERRRAGNEGKPVASGLGYCSKVGDPAVGIRFLGGEELVAPVQLDSNALGGLPALRVEDVR
jgi:hypothetical protein